MSYYSRKLWNLQLVWPLKIATKKLSFAAVWYFGFRPRNVQIRKIYRGLIFTNCLIFRHLCTINCKLTHPLSPLYFIFEKLAEMPTAPTNLFSMLTLKYLFFPTKLFPPKNVIDTSGSRRKIGTNFHQLKSDWELEQKNVFKIE